MQSERISLKEAAARLGLTESGARARFRRGELYGERDNSGKIWVYLEPSVQPALQPALQPDGAGSASSDAAALGQVVERLTDELRQARLDQREERERLTGQIDELRAALDTERERRHEAEIRAAEGLLARLGRMIGARR